MLTKLCVSSPAPCAPLASPQMHVTTAAAHRTPQQTFNTLHTTPTMFFTLSCTCMAGCPRDCRMNGIWIALPKCATTVLVSLLAHHLLALLPYRHVPETMCLLSYRPQTGRAEPVCPISIYIPCSTPDTMQHCKKKICTDSVECARPVEQHIGSKWMKTPRLLCNAV